MSLLGAAEIRELAEALDLKPSKSLGQNFVHDGNVCRKIVRTAGLTSTDVALRVTQKINLDLPFCVMKELPKLAFDAPGLPESTSTRCMGFILYFPSAKNYEKRIEEFKELYSLLGRVFV